MTTPTPAEFAAKLHGRQYRSEITREEAKEAKDAGLVVVFGASDDLMELRGAIYDEVDCFRGGTCRIDTIGVLDHRAELDHMAILEYADRSRRSVELRAVWNDSIEYESPAWSYETAVPHATFEVLEDAEVYCRGIVFKIADLVELVQPTMKLAVVSSADEVPAWLDPDFATELREMLSTDWDSRSAMILRFDDGPPEVHMDGGDPEDATFARDYAWIEDALRRAYAAGRAAACGQIRAEHEAIVRESKQATRGHR